MKKVKILFTNEWKNSFVEIADNEKRYFSSGFMFNYNSKTTFKDLMFELNKKLINTLTLSKDEHVNDLGNLQNLKFIYRIIEYNKAIYIFDVDAKIEDYIDNKKEKFILVSLTIFVEKGAGIVRKNGINFIINSNEESGHNIPHVHVRYSGYEAVYDFESNLIEGKLPKNKNKEAKEIIKLNKDSLIFAWNNLSNSRIIAIPEEELKRII